MTMKMEDKLQKGISENTRAKHGIVQLIALLFLLQILISFQAKANPRDDYDFSSPYSTLKFFKESIEQSDDDIAISALALNVGDPRSERSKNLAYQFKRILDARSLIIKPDKAPKNPEYTDSITGENVYQVFKSEIYIKLEKVGNRWLFSKETIDWIPEIYEELYPMELTKFIDGLPLWLRTIVLGVELWQIIGLIAYLLVSCILYRIMAWLFGKFLVKVFGLFKHKRIAEKYIKPLAKPISIIVVILILYEYLPILHYPASFNIVFKYIKNLAIPLSLTIISYRFMDVVSEALSFIASKTKTNVDDNLVPLIRKVLKIFVIITGVIYTVQNLGVDITPLIAGVSIGGLAFALAAQDTIKNFFGSLTIYTDKPFETGDWIITENIDGVIEEIGVRSTRIRTFSNSLLTIPNGKLADMTIDNMGKREMRRFLTRITIPYDTQPDKISAFTTGIKQIALNQEYVVKEKVEASLYDFAEGYLVIRISCYFNCPTFIDELSARDIIISDLLKLASTLEIKMTFPKEIQLLENKADDIKHDYVKQ